MRPPAAPRSLACAHRTENSKVGLTRLHAQSLPTPRVLSLPAGSRITRSQSARLRTSCAPGMRAAPGQVPRGAACRPLCGTELRRGSSSRPPLPWDAAAAAAAASERPAEAVAAICGAEGAARSRPPGGELSSAPQDLPGKQSPPPPSPRGQMQQWLFLPGGPRPKGKALLFSARSQRT